MTQTLTKLNKLVISFLETNQDNADVAKEWMSTANQNAVSNLLNKNEKTVGKVIDPNAPKRGKSAYLFFCNAMRDKVKKTLGADSKATDVTRELGVQWNTLKEDTSRRKELAKYETMAAEDKARYEQERDTYVPDESALITKKPRRVKAAPTGPKRAKSAYLFFCTEMRDKVRGELEDNSATNVILSLVFVEYPKEQVRYKSMRSRLKRTKPVKKREGRGCYNSHHQGQDHPRPLQSRVFWPRPVAKPATPKTAPAKGRGGKVAVKK